MEHVVLFTMRDDVSGEDTRDLISSLNALEESVPGVVDLSVGEDFSGRSGGYTHGLVVRLRTRDDLQGYMQHPDHLAVVEKLDQRTTGRIVVDYEPET
ncbi:Dabb family protein [Rubrobacter aplysinae]|uniref:Dabb family protein n=1 Tax=Rubrobacter aplysinae TaxID=909625 RepID=UPI001F2CCAD9|nr:Dabb family protein [Rubrobacter aplysinae]